MNTVFNTLLPWAAGIILFILVLRIVLIACNYQRLLIYGVVPLDRIYDEPDKEDWRVTPSLPFWKRIATGIVAIILIAMIVLSLISIFLWFNRCFLCETNITAPFFGKVIDNLHIEKEVLFASLSVLRIATGIFFLIEPICELRWFKYQCKRLKPKGRMMTGPECHKISVEIGRRFYTKPYSLMTQERKELRRLSRILGSTLIVASIIMLAVDIVL